MRILLVHRNFFVDGGDSNYTLKLAHLLIANGHNVSVLTLQDTRNDDFLIKLFEIPNSFDKSKRTRFEELSNISKIKYGINSIFSLSAYKTTKNLIQNEKFDIIHIQNIHHVLTSSVVYALKDKDVPIIWTLHDYKLLCPASNFFLNGEICEKCKGNKFYNVVKNKCKRDSLFGSLSVMVSSYLDQIIQIKKFVHKFITPSNFLKYKLIEYGFEKDKVINLPNFITREDRGKNKSGDYVLYYGNFSQEKGVDLLLQVCKELTNIPFLFVGSGPLEKEVRNASEQMNNIAYYPFLEKEDVKRVIREARFIVIPSQWYENFPFTALEPMALGKTIIASRIGGIPEIVEDGVSGVLVSERSSISEWVLKIKGLYYDESRIRMYEDRAYDLILKFSEEEHIKKIENLYLSVCKAEKIPIT